MSSSYFYLYGSNVLLFISPWRTVSSLIMKCTLSSNKDLSRREHLLKIEMKIYLKASQAVRNKKYIYSYTILLHYTFSNHKNKTAKKMSTSAETDDTVSFEEISTWSINALKAFLHIRGKCSDGTFDELTAR